MTLFVRGESVGAFWTQQTVSCRSRHRRNLPRDGRWTLKQAFDMRPWSTFAAHSISDLILTLGRTT